MLVMDIRMRTVCSDNEAREQFRFPTAIAFLLCHVIAFYLVT